MRGKRYSYWTRSLVEDGWGGVSTSQVPPHEHYLTPCQTLTSCLGLPSCPLSSPLPHHASSILQFFIAIAWPTPYPPLRPIYGCVRDTKATAFGHTTAHPNTPARAHAVTAVIQPARLARMSRFYLQGHAHAYTPLYTQAYARTHSPLLMQLHPRIATQREGSQGRGKMGSWGRWERLSLARRACLIFNFPTI